MTFLEKMCEAIGTTPLATLPETIDTKRSTKKQDRLYIQVMDYDMADNFFSIGHNDLCDFVNKFVANEYSYHVGGVFGSQRKEINEGKKNWYDAFTEKAVSIKKIKTKMYIDMTNPIDTIKEVNLLMRVTYPDLIVGF